MTSSEKERLIKEKIGQELKRRRSQPIMGPNLTPQPPEVIRNPGTAAVLSVLIPGLGQIGKGIFFILFVPLYVLFTFALFLGQAVSGGSINVGGIMMVAGFFIVPAFWILNIFDAYRGQRGEPPNALDAYHISPPRYRVDMHPFAIRCLPLAV